MSAVLTDDELSEFAEFLWHVCGEANGRGLRVLPHDRQAGRCCCPLGALGGGMPRYPVPSLVAHRLGIWEDALRSFATAFDGGSWTRSPRMSQLGKLFREHALETEGVFG